jgi:hypothetical protein
VEPRAQPPKQILIRLQLDKGIEALCHERAHDEIGIATPFNLAAYKEGAKSSVLGIRASWTRRI